MANRQSPPNWVAERARCRLDLVFEALGQVVRRDVDEMNALSPQQRRGFGFSFEQNGGGTEPLMRVRRAHVKTPDDSLSVTFKQTINAIIVEPPIAPKKMGFEVTPKWNDQACSCDLFVDEEKLEIWQVSQRALTPLFFG